MQYQNLHTQYYIDSFSSFIFYVCHLSKEVHDKIFLCNAGEKPFVTFQKYATFATNFYAKKTIKLANDDFGKVKKLGSKQCE